MEARFKSFRDEVPVPYYSPLCAAMAEEFQVKLLENCLISPPPGSVPTTTISLSFLDYPWILCPPVQRIFFYDLSLSSHEFRNTVFLSLKNSLSLALRHFFPLAANLVCPPSPLKPYILYTQGEDSLLLSLAEALPSNFPLLISDHPQQAKNLRRLVPDLQEARVLPDGARVVPLMSILFTVFPNRGVSLGITFNHVAADGVAFHHFMKWWASICRTGDSEVVGKSPPIMDRSLIRDNNKAEPELLKEWLSWGASWSPNAKPSDDIIAGKLKATVTINKTQIEALKIWISKNNSSDPFLVSSFVAVCSLIWFCLIKSREVEKPDISESETQKLHFGFTADCRSRMEYEVPPTFFGNCLAISVATVKDSDLKEENGVLTAAKAIGKRVKELEEGAVKGAARWMRDWKEAVESGKLVTVAGSPRLKAYETDMGWGRPVKSEIVHVDRSGSMAIMESRDEESGGVEVGVILTSDCENSFYAILDQNLRAAMSAMEED